MEIHAVQQNLHWDPRSANNHLSDDEFESGNSASKLFERSRITALADEREAVQKKTFTKWVNSHLAKMNCRIDDLFLDLTDGKMLLKLLEVLSGEKLPKPTRGKMRIHCLENLDKSMNFLAEQHVHLENMGAHDIVDGNQRLTLGLIWTIILRFQIQDLPRDETDQGETRTAKDTLLLWCQMKTAGYNNVNIRNFTTSWRDGLAFNAIIHKHRPDLIDYVHLSKSTPLENLSNAFNVAENELGITKLLDAEDVIVEQPDEKSIITYVVTYYHYFNKLKADAVHSKRVGKVVGQAIEAEQMIDQYRSLASDLLQWIKNTIEVLDDREFANSLGGVQQQLGSFNSYRTIEKPPKFTEKGNLEILLFTIQSKMRASNLKPYMPAEGEMMSDINKAWELLEKTEHNREFALRDELIRQEKLEQLASRFDRKAGMRETWLSENQRLVAQDNFGDDLGAVEAATKKHEAIETDILSYEERVNAVNAVAAELHSENYHDVRRITARKENVLRLWNDLLELLKKRRLRLQLSLRLQHVFQEILYLMDWIDEIKTRLKSEDYGKHLMGVEDLLQKHNLLEADIRVLGNRMNQVLDQAEPFIECNFEEEVGADYKPCEPEAVKHRGDQLRAEYAALLELGAGRQNALEESRRMWQFFWEMEDDKEWIREKALLMSSPDLGHDLSSVERLIRKHKAMEEELQARQTVLDAGMKRGESLIAKGNLGSENVKERIADMKDVWERLVDMTTERKTRLLQSLDFYQLMSECDDSEAWFLEVLRLVSSEHTGNNLASTESLIKSNQSVIDELEAYQENINQLHEQGAKVSEYQDMHSDVVKRRLDEVDKRYHDLLKLAQQRQQRLHDALSMYKVFDVADNVKTWITEKEKLLATLVVGEEMEELEVIRHRFGGFENEMAGNAAKVSNVNQLSENLLSTDHPSSEQILARQDSLNLAWNKMADVVDGHRRQLNSAYEYNQYLIECRETANWIREKEKLIESTDELGNDLDGIMQLQRRLGGLERDLSAIEAKVTHLNEQADTIIDTKPETKETVNVERTKINELWAELKQMLKERESRLSESSELQRYLQDLDHFQMWLSRTSTMVASEDVPKDLQEAEKLIGEHEQLGEEVESRGEEFHRLMEFGRRITEGQTDAQYVFLSQRLNGLEEGWEAIHKMCDDRKTLLQQSIQMQIFFRDAIQVDVMLSQQENFLSKEDVPTALEVAQNALKEHDNFMMTMAVNDDKVNAVVGNGRRLVEEGNFAAEKIEAKCDHMLERQASNKKRAVTRKNVLDEQILLQEFFQDVDDLEEWIAEKMIVATDDSYRAAKNIAQRYSRFRAFEEEIGANKDTLEKVIKTGEDLMHEHPQLTDQIEPRIEDLRRQWDELNTTASEKSAKMADANREILFDETAKSMMSWMTDVSSQIITTEEIVTEEIGLVEINEHLKDQEKKDDELKQKKRMLEDLEVHASKLKEQYPEKEEQYEQMQQEVRIKLTELEAPMASRRGKLTQQKRVRQFFRDIEDEKDWIREKLTLVEEAKLGASLLTVQQLIRRHKMLGNEVDNHQPRITAVCQAGEDMISEGHDQSDMFRVAMDDLWELWHQLERAIESRQLRLEMNEAAQQYLFDASEAEAWMAEQELYLMGEERAKDDQAANNAMKKHEQLEKTIENYGDEIRALGERSQTMISEDHPEGEVLSHKQSRVDKMYAGLKDLSVERRLRLEELLRLYQLLREILDLEAWIAERTVVASSHERGLDYEHCCLLRDRFSEFAKETNDLGSARVTSANELCDALIEQGHGEAAEIAQYKDRVNEAWADLLELIETRIQLLKAAWDMHKFLCDSQDVLDRIVEKSSSIPEEMGKDAKAVAALQRKHASFEYELTRLGQQVEAVVDTANHLLPSYAGDQENVIVDRREDVLNAWRRLQQVSEQRKIHLLDAADFHRFFSMVRELRLWMETVRTEMDAKEKPRDVSGVELLMNSHRSVKAEIDAREENFSICVSLGVTLLKRAPEGPRSKEVREKGTALVTERVQLGDRWSERWEELQLMLEVYQFARDAAVAESWLMNQEPYLTNHDLGDSLDETMALLKRHDAFERAVGTQEDRFDALKRLTTLELKAKERSEETLAARELERKRRIEEAVKVFLPPPPAPKKPVQTEPRLEHAKTLPTSSQLVRTASHPAGDAPPTKQPSTREAAMARKHEWESANKKASSRAWHELYVVFSEGQISVHKDVKQFRARPTEYYRHETPVKVAGAFAAPATDYGKRPNVFRLKMANGGEFLFQARSPEDMRDWIDALNMAAGVGGTGAAKSATLPHPTSSSSAASPTEAPAGGKKKFFTLGRKK